MFWTFIPCDVLKLCTVWCRYCIDPFSFGCTCSMLTLLFQERNVGRRSCMVLYGSSKYRYTSAVVSRFLKISDTIQVLQTDSMIIPYITDVLYICNVSVTSAWSQETLIYTCIVREKGNVPFPCHVICKTHELSVACTVPCPCSNFNSCSTPSSRWQRQWIKVISLMTTSFGRIQVQQMHLQSSNVVCISQTVLF